MFKRQNIFACSLLFLALVLSCDKDNFIDPNDERYGTNEAEIQLNFGSTFQRIHHFGASGGFQEQWVGRWPDASREPVAEYLFSSELDAQGNPKGIGLSHWRVIIGDGAQDQANSGFVSSSWFRETECYLSPNGTYDWTKQAGSQWFLQKARDYGVPSFTAWATTPPYFMTENGFTFRTPSVSGFNCPPSNYQAYADFLAEVMKFYESQGFVFDVVCPFNETQYLWEFQEGAASQSGTFCSNAEVAQVTRIIDETFTNEGVNAKIMIPEAAQLRYLYEGSANTTNQLFDFFSDSSPNYIGDLDNLSNNIAGHSYFSNGTASETITQRTSLRSALNSFGDLNYWQSEYSLLGTAYQQGQDVSSLEEIDYSLWLARIIHSDLAFGDATAWDFWTALNTSTFGDHPFRFNLILYTPNSNSPSHTDGVATPVKNLWALGNYSRFVRPGMLRFDVVDEVYGSGEQALDNFMISGYIDPDSDEIVLVCVNRTNEQRQLNLGGYGTEYTVVGDSFDAYTTSSTKNLEHSVIDANEPLIEAKSIVTLKATLSN